MQFTVKGGITPILRDLQRIQKTMPKVAAKAINKTAFEVRDALKKEMAQVFDNPRPFTLNSLYVLLASPGNLTAKVGLKDFAAKGTPAAKYLAAQIEGGGRPHKRFEKWLIYHGIMASSKFAIPANGVKLDKYGNPSNGLYTQILSALGANPDTLQNQTLRSKDRAKRKSGYRYFVVQRSGESVGIGRARGAVGPLEMLFFFGRQPQYRRRFFFHETARRVSRQMLPIKLDEVWMKELARGR